MIPDWTTFPASPVSRQTTERKTGSNVRVLATSATLSSGEFQSIKTQAGLPESTFFHTSPFDLPGGYLACNMGEPSDTESHTVFIVAALPHPLPEPVAAPMLFSSRRQMVDVMSACGIFRIWCCVRTLSESPALEIPQQRVDQGLNSLIFGLASFAEG